MAREKNGFRRIVDGARFYWRDVRPEDDGFMPRVRADPSSAPRGGAGGRAASPALRRRLAGADARPFGERCPARSAIAHFDELFGATLGWTIGASEADAIFAAMPDAKRRAPDWAPAHHTWWAKEPRS